MDTKNVVKCSKQTASLENRKIIAEDKRARELGLSYGQYKALIFMGKLDAYIERRRMLYDY